MKGLSSTLVIIPSGGLAEVGLQMWVVPAHGTMDFCALPWTAPPSRSLRCELEQVCTGLRDLLPLHTDIDMCLIVDNLGFDARATLECVQKLYPMLPVYCRSLLSRDTAKHGEMEQFPPDDEDAMRQMAAYVKRIRVDQKLCASGTQ